VGLLTERVSELAYTPPIIIISVVFGVYSFDQVALLLTFCIPLTCTIEM